MYTTSIKTKVNGRRISYLLPTDAWNSKYVLTILCFSYIWTVKKVRRPSKLCGVTQQSMKDKIVWPYQNECVHVAQPFLHVRDEFKKVVSGMGPPLHNF